MFQSKAFQSAIWLLLIFLIILVGNQIRFIFRPVGVLITTIFFPVLLAGILFYLTDPIVTALMKWKIPRVVGIWIVFLLLGGLLLVSIVGLVPVLEQQLSSLARNLPGFLRQLDRYFAEFQQSTIFSQFEQLEIFQRWSNIDYISLLDGLLETMPQNIIAYIGSVANFVIALFTVPFLLFYMLRDGHKLPNVVSQVAPERYQGDVEGVFHDINKTISSYIQGQLVVSLFVGIFVYIGYIIIGLDYALLLAAVALVTNIIPYFGPIIGTIPGIIVGLINSPLTALQVGIMVFIVQQVESQLVSPLVLGKKLRIHPVTIIVILLTAGSLAGLVGILLAVPTYAVVKVIVSRISALVRSA